MTVKGGPNGGFKSIGDGMKEANGCSWSNLLLVDQEVNM